MKLSWRTREREIVIPHQSILTWFFMKIPNLLQKTLILTKIVMANIYDPTLLLSYPSSPFHFHSFNFAICPRHPPRKWAAPRNLPRASAGGRGARSARHGQRRPAGCPRRRSCARCAAPDTGTSGASGAPKTRVVPRIGVVTV